MYKQQGPALKLVVNDLYTKIARLWNLDSMVQPGLTRNYPPKWYFNPKNQSIRKAQWTMQTMIEIAGFENCGRFSQVQFKVFFFFFWGGGVWGRGVQIGSAIVKASTSDLEIPPPFLVILFLFLSLSTSFLLLFLNFSLSLNFYFCTLESSGVLCR